jgi:hypothetical protein
MVIGLRPQGILAIASNYALAMHSEMSRNGL